MPYYCQKYILSIRFVGNGMEDNVFDIARENLAAIELDYKEINDD